MDSVKSAQGSKTAQEKVEPYIYQEDLVGYVFMLLLVGSLITGYLFWYFFARDLYPGASTPSRSPGEADPSEEHAPDRDPGA